MRDELAELIAETLAQPYRKVAPSAGRPKGLRPDVAERRRKIPHDAKPVIYQRWLDGASQEQLAKEYGVARQTISYVLAGQRHKAAP